MSDNLENIPEVAEVCVNIAEWVERMRSDPQTYMERQATEIFLTALSISTRLNNKIFLKGGILMGVVYQSPRNTGDLDFTTILEPTEDVANAIRDGLDESFGRAAAHLGYPDFICRVQSSRYRPSREIFAEADGPALKLKVAYARRDTPAAARLQQGGCPTVLDVDISFREPVGAIQIVNLGEGEETLRAYSLYDLIAEKTRALLQQETRNRYRRQDVYDLDTLIGRFQFDVAEQAEILKVLVLKCSARGIDPGPESLTSVEVRRRAREEWDSLELEIGELPDFDECYARVEGFYKSLPWDAR